MIDLPPCVFCKHVHKDGNFGRGRRTTCAAFPGGIPVDILDGKNDHTAPVSGDHGIQFEDNGERPADAGNG